MSGRAEGGAGDPERKARTSVCHSVVLDVYTGYGVSSGREGREGREWADLGTNDGDTASDAALWGLMLWRGSRRTLRLEGYLTILGIGLDW